MSATKARTSSRKRAAESVLNKSESKCRVQDEFDLDLSSDLKGIMSALQQIREKAQKDGQKEEQGDDFYVSDVGAEIRSMMDELKSKIEKDRQGFAKALSKSSKECENCLKNETAKFQEIYDKFYKEKAAHLQSLQDTVSKFEQDKEKLLTRYEQGKERSVLVEQEKACADKLAKLEESLKKKKQDDKTFSILRKTVGTFLDNGSDEEFPQDD